ncbi:Cupredoxin [Zopfochytrium polystomum]|nr:Cupredoxin [Zopfochytrium polystomum]
MSMGLSTRFVKFPPPISMGMRHAVNLVLALAHVAFTASSIVLSLTPQGEPSSLWQKLSVAAPITKFKLVLNYTEAAPDGFRQTLKLVNGMLDYPIVVNAGDSVEIAVTNALDEPTAIHWHGLFQRGTPWMDGAAMVTQCPIQPGETFVYKFSVGDQVGSYWYHAHHKAQYVDGLRGPFIVKDSKAPFADQYDDEIVITLADLFHNKSSFLLDYFFSPNEGTLDPVPESLLINGVGYYPCQFAPLGSKCTPTTFPSNEVVFGKRYLLRIINMSGEAAFTFSIDGHNLTVVEADGVYTVPTVVDQFPITAGQRYSVILNANAKVSNYWIRADLDEQLYFPAPIDLNGLVPYARSILRYKGAAKTNPTTKAAQNPTVLNPFNLGEYNGTPLTQLVPHLGDTMYMNFKILSDGDNNITTATVSAGDFVDSQWQPPSYPTILDVLDDVRLPDSTNGVEVSNDSYLLLHITNDDPMEHPFHLHGHTFWILLSGKLLFAPSTLPSANYTVGLPRRDTIQVPPLHGRKRRLRRRRMRQRIRGHHHPLQQPRRLAVPLPH